MASYQPYPNTPSPDGQNRAQRPAPPGPVANAIRLMYAGAVVELMVALGGLASYSTIKSTVQQRDTALTPAQVHGAAVVAEVLIVVFGLVPVGLWIWMAAMCGRGRNWARVLSTVFFGISVLSVLLSLPGAAPVWDKAIGVIPVVVGLICVVLLWQPASSEFFRSPPGGPPSPQADWYPPPGQYPPISGQYPPPQNPPPGQYPPSGYGYPPPPQS
jgi:hypothetical protein